MQRRSSQLKTTYAVAKERLKKFRLARIRALTSAMLVQRSKQLS